MMVNAVLQGYVCEGCGYRLQMMGVTVVCVAGYVFRVPVNGTGRCIEGYLLLMYQGASGQPPWWGRNRRQILPKEVLIQVKKHNE
jgi:hypothetical protein